MHANYKTLNHPARHQEPEELEQYDATHKKNGHIIQYSLADNKIT